MMQDTVFIFLFPADNATIASLAAKDKNIYGSFHNEEKFFRGKRLIQENLLGFYFSKKKKRVRKTAFINLINNLN